MLRVHTAYGEVYSAWKQQGNLPTMRENSDVPSHIQWDPFGKLELPQFFLCDLDEERQVTDFLVKWPAPRSWQRTRHVMGSLS